MKYNRKIYEGDDVINIIMTETARDERLAIYNWCCNQDQNKVMAGHFDNEPQIISFADMELSEKFLQEFNLKE